MAKAAFHTIASVTACECKPYGLRLTIKTQDETAKELPYALAITSTGAGLAHAEQRLAQLARACRLDVITDSEQLIGIPFVLHHDGTAVARVEPLERIKYVDRPVYVDKPSMWRRWRCLWRGEHRLKADATECEACGMHFPELR